ncbi:MAG: hypothetical protein KF678_15470 [Phycisphaeraceae bacterium]|nr:hypothetical protein [Phycisphaeraceae bacterium]
MVARSCFFVMCCACLALVPSPANAQFTATRLSENLSYAYAVRGGIVGGFIINTIVDPVIWPVPGGPPLSLWSPAVGGGRILAMTETHQFGEGGPGAAMWAGTASSMVSLHPVGAETSSILAASSTRQGGWMNFPGQEYQAALWSGTASSVVSLQPPGAINSRVLAMTESHQGGFVRYPGQPGQGNPTHAVMWSGSASSLIDLHPAGYATSGILGMFEDQQVGSATAGGTTRAGMWFGTPESFRSLHPFSDGLSVANATCGSAQVGWMNSVGLGSAGVRAVIWFGTAESVMDLSQFLPPGYGQSIATCVEERNGVFTVGGYVRYGTTDQAFVWTGVPAPGTTMVLIPLAPLNRRRRDP